MRSLAIFAVLVAGGAWSAPTTADSAVSIAILNLEGNKAAAEQALAVTSLIASRLAQAPEVRVISQTDVSTALGLQRQKQLLGEKCTGEACMTELSGAIGARYVVTGRVDGFGQEFVLTASLFDAQRALSLAKPTAQAAGEEGLPTAAWKIGAELLAALGVQPPAEIATAAPGPSSPSSFEVALKLGNSTFGNLLSLAPGADLSFAYRFQPDWFAFLQVGLTFAGAVEDRKLQEVGRFNVVPSIVGARHLYRLDKSLQPYWGLGLGVQLAIGKFGPIAETATLPSVIALFGAQYMVTDHLGLGLEAATNLAQVFLGLRDRVGTGINFDLSATIGYRF